MGIMVSIQKDENISIAKRREHYRLFALDSDITVFPHGMKNDPSAGFTPC